MKICIHTTINCSKTLVTSYNHCNLLHEMKILQHRITLIERPDNSNRTITCQLAHYTAVQIGPVKCLLFPAFTCDIFTI